MFKKRNRQNTNRRAIQREESSEEEPTNPNVQSTANKSEQSLVNKNRNNSSHPSFNSSSTASRFKPKSKMQNSLFSTNKPKFTTKIDFSKTYDDNKESDGFNSIKQTEVELNLEDMKQLKKKQEESDEEPMEEKDDFVPLPNTKNLRSLLRRRLRDFSSDEEEMIPPYSQPKEEEKKTSFQDRQDHQDLQDLQEEVASASASSDEESYYERTIIDRALSGPTVYRSSNPTSMQYEATHFSLVSQEHVMNRLSTALNDLKLNYDDNVRLIAQIEKEIEEIEEDDSHEYANRTTTQQRYDFYQKETMYFRKLSGYLTDRRDELDALYSAYLSLVKQYQWSNHYINQLYLLDDIAYLQELQSIQSIVNELPRVVDNQEIMKNSGPFYKGEIYYSKEFSQTRMADRTLYIDDSSRIRESIRENQNFSFITIPLDFYLTNCIYYNYDDESTEKSMQLFTEKRQEILSIFEEKALQFMNVTEVLDHFRQWRENYPEDYENAYISLSIEDFISVILFPSLLTYDPLELQEENAFHSIRELPWFQSFSNFCETTTQQRDALLLPRYIQKHVIPYLTNIVLYEWNPLSIREASLLQTALSEVASYFNTDVAELRALYAAVTDRIQHAIQSAVYFVPSLVSERTNDIQTDAQEITEMYISRGIRLLEVINTLASFMSLGTAAPLLDNLVTMLCYYLKGYTLIPCLKDRCKQFAEKMNSFIPNEVVRAKEEIQPFL